jgi:hypothetical protein
MPKVICTQDDVRLQEEMAEVILARRREQKHLRLARYLLLFVVAILLLVVFMPSYPKTQSVAFNERFPSQPPYRFGPKTIWGVLVGPTPLNDKDAPCYCPDQPARLLGNVAQCNCPITLAAEKQDKLLPDPAIPFQPVGTQSPRRCPVALYRLAIRSGSIRQCRT